jgi:hypothetical protein
VRARRSGEICIVGPRPPDAGGSAAKLAQSLRTSDGAASLDALHCRCFHWPKQDDRLGDACADLWGSDGPFAAFERKVTYDDVLADFYRLVPDPALRRKITGGTALRLYFM